MTRRRASLILAVVVSVLGSACSDDEPAATPTVTLGPPIDVAIYARNGLAQDVWIAINVAVEPPQAVGFHQRDLGVACLTAPIGALIVVLDSDPTAGQASALQAIGRVEPGQPWWVDITASGAIAGGRGVPAWWTSSGGSDCS